MDASKQRELLKAIAESEYRKIYEQYPILAGQESTYDIEAFSVLNTSRLGISYWHNQHGSGFTFCELNYRVSSYAERNSGVHFRSIEDAEAFLKKTKAKSFKKPFDCYIAKEYSHTSSLDCISDEIFNSLDNDIQLKKTVIYKNKNRYGRTKS